MCIAYTDDMPRFTDKPDLIFKKNAIKNNH